MEKSNILIAVCGTGGMGKSTIAYQLAYNISKSGVKVAVCGDFSKDDYVWNVNWQRKFEDMLLKNNEVVISDHSLLDHYFFEGINPPTTLAKRYDLYVVVNNPDRKIRGKRGINKSLLGFLKNECTNWIVVNNYSADIKYRVLKLWRRRNG
jgi:hypothetical protein